MTIREKVLNGIELDENEVEQLFYCVFEKPNQIDCANFSIVAENFVERNRWCDIYETIVFDKGTCRYFRVYAYIGLTEYQSSDYPEQIAIEVEPYEKVITDYRPINRE